MEETRQNQYNNPVSATLTGIADLFRKHEPAGILHDTDRLDGKTVLVDGASSGLGFAIAVNVARRGAKVIMACRSGIPEMGETVKKLTGNQDIHMLPVDFSDIHSIMKLTEQLQSLLFSGAAQDAIDIYISNAGIVPKQSRKTPQGLEEMFMVNYFSKFIFVNLLINNKLLSQSDPLRTSRIIFIASESHRNPEKFEWSDFGVYKDYGIGKSIELYGYYKLLLTTFSVELSRRLNPSGTTQYSVFSLCPGPVNSNIAREAPKLFQPLLKIVFGIFFRSPRKAAIPAVYLSCSPDVNGKAFEYLFLMSRKEVDGKAADPENGERLWKMSEALWEKIGHGH